MRGGKSYLGDGCYVDYDGYQLVLTAEDNCIYLDAEVYAALMAYVERLRQPASPVAIVRETEGRPPQDNGWDGDCG
jgi:hypothetical protein